MSIKISLLLIFGILAAFSLSAEGIKQGGELKEFVCQSCSTFRESCASTGDFDCAKVAEIAYESCRTEIKEAQVLAKLMLSDRSSYQRAFEASRKASECMSRVIDKEVSASNFGKLCILMSMRVVSSANAE